ncbi:caspase family protein [Azospirillum brasilense]|uniref:caspase family protein n=1 Tax=Azospirillum brasilense TaxID=192 RepID=UPI000E0A3063|nr:caspase family protein [Azospirillum brasilense]
MRKRAALIIGNGEYKDLPLDNPIGDALKVHSLLQLRGFSATLITDIDRANLESHLDAFEKMASESEMALIYFAGHGVEFRGAGYIIPVDAEFPLSAGSLDYFCVPTSALIRALRGCGGPKVLVVDACREGVKGWSAEEWNRSGNFLDVIREQESNVDDTLIAYSTSFGEIAKDGKDGNSLYCKKFCDYALLHGLTIEDVFKKVGFDVMRMTGGAQRPWYYSSLNDRVKFSDMDEFKLIHTKRVPRGAIGDIPSLSGDYDCFETMVSSGNSALHLFTVSSVYTLDRLMPSSVIGTAMAGPDRHVAIDSEGNVFIWNRKSIMVAKISGITPHGVKISPNGMRLLIYGREGVMSVNISSKTFEIIFARDLPWEPYCAAFVSNNEAWIAGQNEKIARLVIRRGRYSLREVEVDSRSRPWSHAYSMAYVPTRNELAITFGNGKIDIFSVKSAKISKTFKLSKHMQSTIARRESLVDTVQGEMITNFLFHPSTLTADQRDFCESQLALNALMFSSASRDVPIIAVGSSEGIVYLLDARDGQIVQQLDVCSDRGSGIEGVQFTRGGLIAVLTADCYLYHYASGSIPLASELPLQFGRLVYQGSSQPATF